MVTPPLNGQPQGGSVPEWASPDSMQNAVTVLSNMEMVEQIIGGKASPELTVMAGQAVIRAAFNMEAARLVRTKASTAGWVPPVSASLAAELGIPRTTPPHRLSGLAGWDHNVLIAGERKVGKSALMVNLSAALSMSLDGQPGRFLGLCEATMRGNVAYINAEMDPDDWRDEFRRLPLGTYNADRIRPLHVRGQAFPVITSPEARRWFTGWLLENQVEVLIIDTWGAFCGKNGVRNMNDDAEVRKVLDALDEIKKATWVASVYVLIHMPHQTGERHSERFKGAGATGDWADALWIYVKDGSESRYLSALGRSRIDFEEQALVWEAETGRLWLSGTGDRASAARLGVRARVLEAVDREPGITTEALLEEAGGNRTEARTLLKKMLADGELKQEKDGQRKKWSRADEGTS